jgi:hypothetical protein
MAQKIVDAEMINTIRRGAEAGLTASQIAATLDVVVTTVRRHAHRHGIQIAKAQLDNSPAIRDKQIKQLNIAEAKRKKAEAQKLRQVASDLAKISNPQERKEALYGQALKAFEMKQSQEGRRPKLPCDAPSPETMAQRMRRDAKNYKPLEIAGITFPSRTYAAAVLGVSRGEFSAMISPKATDFRRQKLARMLGEYKRKVEASEASN